MTNSTRSRFRACFRAAPIPSGFLLVIIATMFIFSHAAPLLAAEPRDAKELVRAAMDHWRGATSYSEMTMTIHRQDWERSMSMRAWSEGTKLSLVRVTEPKKDAGNGTLMKDDSMWSYSPKVNRVIKIPSSMMIRTGVRFSDSSTPSTITTTTCGPTALAIAFIVTGTPSSSAVWLLPVWSGILNNLSSTSVSVS